MVGVKELKEEDGTWVGELDSNGKACGEGILTMKSGNIYKGTLKDDKLHGFGIYECDNSINYGDLVNGFLPANTSY